MYYISNTIDSWKWHAQIYLLNLAGLNSCFERATLSYLPHKLTQFFHSKYLPSAYYVQCNMPGALGSSEINYFLKNFKHIFLIIK